VVGVEGLPTGRDGASEEEPPVSSPKGQANDGTSPNLVGGRERRRHERRRLDRPAALHELDEVGQPGPKMPCVAVDISRSGIGVETKRLLQPGKIVAVLLALPDGRAKVYFGIVRGARYIAHGNHHIGLEFIEAPKLEATEKWLKALPI